MRPALTVSLILLLSATAAAFGLAAERFEELSLGYDRGDPGALERIRAVLAAESPDLLEEPLPPGPLRCDLARAFRRDEVFALFARAAREPEARRERWTNLTRNLCCRDDLPALLVEMGAIAVMLPDDEEVLVPLAESAFLRGQPELARAILADPGSVEEMADRLGASSAAAGLRLLADAAAGAFPLPPEAAARLSAVSYFGEDLPPRTLGADRIEALLRTARTHEDPLRRTLAVRILAASGDPEAFPALLPACAAADGPAIGSWDGFELDYRWLRFPPPGDGPLRFRLALIRWRFGSGNVNADLSFEEADHLAAEARTWLAGERDSRLIGHFLRLLAWAGDFLLVHGESDRRLPVPAYGALLSDLAAGRPDWPEDLARLSRRMADRLRVAIATEEPEPAAGPAIPRPVSPVAEGIRSDALPDDATRARGTIEDWLRLDPGFLFDPDCHEAIGELGTDTMRRLVAAVPRDVLLGLLTHPPSRYRVKEGGFGDDLTGAGNRDRLLELLRIHGERADLLDDPTLVLVWPERNRRLAGTILAEWKVEPEKLDDLLADDEFACGYLSAALLRGPGRIGHLAARLVTGIEPRPGLLAALADQISDYFGDSLVFANPVPRLDGGLRKALAERVRSAADPVVALLAAQLLASSGAPEDLDALLSAGDGLGQGVLGIPHPLSGLVSLAGTLPALDRLLDYVAREDVDPWARADVFSAVARGDWTGVLREEDCETAWERIHAFARDRLPLLGRGVAEAGLTALLDEMSDEEAIATVEAALPKIPVEAIRIRLRITLEEYR